MRIEAVLCDNDDIEALWRAPVHPVPAPELGEDAVAIGGAGKASAVTGAEVAIKNCTKIN